MEITVHTGTSGYVHRAPLVSGEESPCSTKDKGTEVGSRPGTSEFLVDDQRKTREVE